MFTLTTINDLCATQRDISIYSSPTKVIENYNRLNPTNPLTTKQVLTTICGEELQLIADIFGVSMDAVLLVISAHHISINDLISIRFGRTDTHDINNNTFILIARKGAIVEKSPRMERARNGRKRVVGYEKVYYNIYLGYNQYRGLGFNKLIRAMFQTYFPMAYTYFSTMKKRFSKDVREFDYKPHTLLKDLPSGTRYLTLKDIADIINSNNECLEATEPTSMLDIYYNNAPAQAVTIYLRFLNPIENNYHTFVCLPLEAFKTNNFSLIENEIVHDYDYKTQIFADIPQCQSSAWSDKETIGLIKGYFDKVKNS